MVDLISDEQKVKPDSVFLKLQNGCKVTIKSHLVRLFTYFDNSKKKTILWSELLNQPKRQEFYYWVELQIGEDKTEGIARIPGPIFFSMNENERLLEKDKRCFVWIISKQGEGLKTKYEAVRGVDAPEITADIIDSNSKKLQQILTGYESKLAEGLRNYLEEQKVDVKKKKKLT